MNTMTMSAPTRQIAGSIHRFGRNGILYEVLREVDENVALIRVLETGEETKYPIKEILADPAE